MGDIEQHLLLWVACLKCGSHALHACESQMWFMIGGHIQSSRETLNLLIVTRECIVSFRRKSIILISLLILNDF